RTLLVSVLGMMGGSKLLPRELPLVAVRCGHIEHHGVRLERTARIRYRRGRRRSEFRPPLFYDLSELHSLREICRVSRTFRSSRCLRAARILARKRAALMFLMMT